MRNYILACMESEARLALLAHGCDPSMGCLHADQRNRDSLALDAMEPVRADVDAFLLDLLEDRKFTARDFSELPNGVCRIAAPLTHELALTLAHWRECLRPIAARLAQTFRESLLNKGAAPRTLAATTGNKRRSIPGPERSPLLATPRKASQPRPYATRAWRAPTVEARPSSPIWCAMCGEPVLKRRRRHCEACMPKARREHGLRAIATARKALAAQSAAGNDPRRGAVVNRARGEAISEGHRRNRSWAREHPGQRDEAWFKREITPKLDGFLAREIGGGELIARGLLANPGRCEGATSTALGGFAKASVACGGALAQWRQDSFVNFRGLCRFLALSAALYAAASGFSVAGPFGQFSAIVISQDARPTNILVTDTGELWFTDLAAEKIGRITPTHEITEYTVPTKPANVRGLAIGPDGNVWFAEFIGGKIGRITPDGAIENSHWARAGTQRTLSPAKAVRFGLIWRALREPLPPSPRDAPTTQRSVESLLPGP